MFPLLRKKLPLGKNEKQITHGASPTVPVLESDSLVYKNQNKQKQNSGVPSQPRFV